MAATLTTLGSDTRTPVVLVAVDSAAGVAGEVLDVFAVRYPALVPRRGERVHDGTADALRKHSGDFTGTMTYPPYPEPRNRT